jgi:hypothetical protein
MFVIIVLTVYYGGIELPLSVGYYSPPAAFMAPIQERGRVYVTGRIVHQNESLAVNVTIRLFATDELIEDFVVTDDQGEFISNVRFEAGQIITVRYEGRLLTPSQHQQNFIQYDAPDRETVWIGTYYLP